MTLWMVEALPTHHTGGDLRFRDDISICLYLIKGIHQSDFLNVFGITDLDAHSDPSPLPEDLGIRIGLKLLYNSSPNKSARSYQVCKKYGERDNDQNGAEGFQEGFNTALNWHGPVQFDEPSGLEIFLDPQNFVQEVNESNNKITCTSLNKVDDNPCLKHEPYGAIIQSGYSGPCPYKEIELNAN